MPQDIKNTAQPDAGFPARISSRDLIEGVRELLAAPDGTRMEIIRRIEQLQVASTEHFERLSDQDIFEETVFHAPWLTPLSECLRQQHAELEAMLERLVTRARSEESGLSWRREMRGLLDGFAELYLELDAGILNLTQSRQGWQDDDL